VGEQMAGKLYLVGTPIGNLGDFTYRAVDTLNNVDCIACEDTRHSSILLNHYNIHKPTMSYHKFNEKQATNKIIEMLKSGKNIAIITDAGMPSISDPGAILLKEVISNNMEFELVPSATAVTTAYVGSNLGDGRFCFIGFLPTKNIDKKKLLNEYKDTTSTLIFYSATHAINDDLDFLFKTLGNKEVVIASELTKKFEKFYRGNLSTLRVENAKGEFVIMVQNVPKENPLNQFEIEEHLAHYLKSGLSKMDAIKAVAKDRNVKKNEIYNFINKE